jgi:hypothetical protein
LPSAHCENHLADELLALSPEAFAKRLSAGVEVRFGEFETRSWRGVLDTTLCDRVCQ